MKNVGEHILRIIILSVAIFASVTASLDFMDMRKPDILLPGKGVTQTKLLSDYCSLLTGTIHDTPIYILDSPQKGAVVLVLGGTHPNEPAGFIAATVLVEQGGVSVGRLIVIPQISYSGYTCTDPLEGYPERFSITTRTGKRIFRFGSRGFSPVDQWPDPLVYLQYPSGQQLSGAEMRNLNRAYPGRVDGTLTERVGYALMELINKEHVDLAIDLHEAAPEIPIINALVTHQKNQELGSAIVLNLELEGMQYALEVSPTNFRGLSHREWGDRTEVLPFLMETSNPIQGRIRGKTFAGLIIDGKDDYYRRAAELGTVRITYDPHGESLSCRVGRHLQGILSIFNTYNEQTDSRKIIIHNIPTYQSMVDRGIGEYLN
jgi:hypothetical protein